MQLVIIDYGSGNLRSAAKALEHVAPDGMRVRLSSDATEIAKADYLVLPGVGAFADCYQGLTKIPDILDILQQHITVRQQPFLGICVGMQLCASRGDEFGGSPGLDLIAGTVAKITPGDPSLKIPHMGWNQLQITQPHPVLQGINSGDYAYFVHSFHVQTATADTVLATCAYGQPITAIIGQGSVIGTQFHPEKSQDLGLLLLANYTRWRP